MEQFQDLLVIILIGAAVISMMTGNPDVSIPVSVTAMTPRPPVTREPL